MWGALPDTRLVKHYRTLVSVICLLFVGVNCRIFIVSVCLHLQSFLEILSFITAERFVSSMGIGSKFSTQHIPNISSSCGNNIKILQTVGHSVSGWRQWLVKRRIWPQINWMLGRILLLSFSPPLDLPLTALLLNIVRY